MHGTTNIKLYLKWSFIELTRCSILYLTRAALFCSTQKYVLDVDRELWFMAEASCLLQLVIVVLKNNFRVKFPESWQRRVSQASWMLAVNREKFQHLSWQEWVFITRFAGYYQCHVLSCPRHWLLIFPGRGLRPKASGRLFSQTRKIPFITVMNISQLMESVKEILWIYKMCHPAFC